MGEFWLQFLLAALAAASAASMVPMFRRARARQVADLPEVPPERAANAPRAAGEQLPVTETRPEPELDPWRCELRRCEQAVHRAWCAVDTVSSAHARAELRSVVCRMEAELPTARALAELGRSLTTGTSSRSGDAVARRMLRQLADVASAFGVFTDRVLAVVGQLVAEPGLDRVRRQVDELRGGFPLLPPMSALLGSGAGGPRAGELLDPVG